MSKLYHVGIQTAGQIECRVPVGILYFVGVLYLVWVFFFTMTHVIVQRSETAVIFY